MTSGRVRLRCSLQPSYFAPPKSSAERPRDWIIVPMAPARTRMRRLNSSARRAERSGRLMLSSSHRLSPGMPWAKVMPGTSAAFLPLAKVDGAGLGSGILAAREDLGLLHLLGAGGGQALDEQHPPGRLEVGE